MPFSILIKGHERLSGFAQTQYARARAQMGRGCRFTHTGRLHNILGDRNAVVVGANCVIAGDLTTYGHGGSIRIGDWCFVGPGSRIWSASEITIGCNVLISHNVDIHDNNSHPLDAEARFRHAHQMFTRGHPRVDPGIKSAPVWIGNDVWIGFGASIFKGVRIGHRAIIGARAIIVSSVPDDAVVRAQPTDVSLANR